MGCCPRGRRRRSSGPRGTSGPPSLRGGGGGRGGGEEEEEKVEADEVSAARRRTRRADEARGALGYLGSRPRMHAGTEASEGGRRKGGRRSAGPGPRPGRLGSHVGAGEGLSSSLLGVAGGRGG